MKTIHKLFLIAIIALGLGFVACNDADDVPLADDSNTNTHVSVSLSLSTGASTRAGLPDDYRKIGAWAGKDKIETIAVYLVDGGAVTAKTFEVGTGKDYIFSDGKLLPNRENAAIKTTAGDKEVYVLINGTSEVVNHLAMAPVAAFKKSFEETALALANSGTSTTVETSASKIAVKDGTTDETIVMTSVVPGKITVDEKVTAAETIASTDAKNRVSVNVERAVARVMVTIADAASFQVKDVDNNLVGTVTNVTWVLAQGENKLYVQRKSDWNTPSFDWVPANNTEYISYAGDNYDYSGLFESRTTHFGGTEVATMDSYTDVPNKVTAELNNKLSGKFVLPTTHKVATGDASNYKKGNTPYVLVRAQFTPSNVFYADGGSYTAGGDFFVGANGKFYTSATNAVTPAKGGVAGQTVARYVGGKVLYYAWLNPDNVAEPYNSPVLRNNIYHIHITGFKNLGTNWNPLFPEVPPTLTNPNDPWHPVHNPIKPGGGENPDPKPVPEEGDPNYPDPTDPDDPVYPNEPENPIDPEDPLTTPVTYMSVDVTVLPWILHSYSVDLGM